VEWSRIGWESLLASEIYFEGLKCTRCPGRFPVSADLLRCPDCSSLLDPFYDLDRLRADLPRLRLEERLPTIWKWKELLPVVDLSKIVTLGEGGSPFIDSPSLASRMGVRRVFVLNDGSSMPSGSLKDRSVAVAATKAVEFGYPVLSCDSTGNKAASVAAYAARAGIASVVFCPHETPLPKIAQALFHGAKVIRVRGHFSEVNALYRRLLAGREFRWYDCGTDNPYRYEGKKTYAYDVASALADSFPTKIFHPAAGCMSIVKMWKGFEEMQKLSLAPGSPALVACQPEACAPIVKAWKEGARSVSAVPKGKTVASALAFADPGDLGDATLDAIRRSNGSAVAVSDEAVLAAWKDLGRLGIFSEPSGAISLAAALELAGKGKLDRDDVLVLNVTGTGFKDFETLLANVQVPERIAEGFEELKREAGKFDAERS
jgi:threonine synthase